MVFIRNLRNVKNNNESVATTNNFSYFSNHILKHPFLFLYKIIKN